MPAKRPLLRSVLVRATGDPRIRATHAKTLELTSSTAITARATCVVGVGATIDAAGLGLLRGEVALTLSAGGATATGQAVINPDHTVRDRLVIRRSDRLSPETVAVRSTLAAADLDPGLVAALADPASQVTLTLTETGRRQPLVLIRRTDRQADAQADHQADRQASSGECSRLGLLWNHADATIELGMPAPDALEPAGLAALDRCGIVAVRVPCRLEDCPSTVWSWLAGAARRGARFVVLDEQLSAATTALLAAGLPHAPVLWLGRIDRRLARDPAIATLLRRTTAPVVLTIPTSDLDIVAEVLASTAAGQAIAVPDSRLDCGVAARWLADDAGATPEATVAAVAGSSREETTLVVAPGQGEADHTDLAPVVLALIDAGVSPRTLGCALRPFGMGRRQVYQAIRGKEGE